MSPSAGNAPRGARARAGHSADPQRSARYAALIFYALPAAFAVWTLGIAVALRSGDWGFDSPAFKLQSLMLPLVALFGVVGAWQLKRSWVLGSAAGLGVGALLATPSPPLALFYALAAAMMYLTSRKLR